MSDDIIKDVVTSVAREAVEDVMKKSKQELPLPPSLEKYIKDLERFNKLRHQYARTGPNILAPIQRALLTLDPAGNILNLNKIVPSQSFLGVNFIYEDWKVGRLGLEQFPFEEILQDLDNEQITFEKELESLKSKLITTLKETEREQLEFAIWVKQSELVGSQQIEKEILSAMDSREALFGLGSRDRLEMSWFDKALREDPSSIYAPYSQQLGSADEIIDKVHRALNPIRIPFGRPPFGGTPLNIPYDELQAYYGDLNQASANNVAMIETLKAQLDMLQRAQNGEINSPYIQHVTDNLVRVIPNYIGKLESQVNQIDEYLNHSVFSKLEQSVKESDISTSSNLIDTVNPFFENFMQNGGLQLPEGMSYEQFELFTEDMRSLLEMYDLIPGKMQEITVSSRAATEAMRIFEMAGYQAGAAIVGNLRQMIMTGEDVEDMLARLQEHLIGIILNAALTPLQQELSGMLGGLFGGNDAKVPNATAQAANIAGGLFDQTCCCHPLGIPTVAADPAAIGNVEIMKEGGGVFSNITSMFSKLFTDLLPNIFGIFKNLFSSLFGGIGNLLGSIFGALFADGAAFQNGNVMPFARGGVVRMPTLFPMAGGRRGLMGEAGPEAILPLRRGRGGRLGVEASGGAVNVNIHNNVGAHVQTRERRNAHGGMDIDVMIDEAVGRNIARGGMTAKALETRFGLRPATFGR